MERFYIQKIKQLLKEKNLTYRDLSKGISKSATTLLNIMNGKSRLDVDTLIEIARVLNVPITYFFENDLLGQTESQPSDNELKIKLDNCQQLLQEKERIIKEKDKQIKLQDELIKVLKEKR